MASAGRLAAGYRRTVPDVIRPGLDVLFVGVNPSLYSGLVGQHFARPGNRFWTTLHLAGFTGRRLSPADTADLLDCGLGVTNLVAGATARADELSAAELRAGAVRLTRVAQRWRPRFVAVLGVTAYRVAFGRPGAAVGRLPDPVGPAAGWLLPNPSGRAAAYQQPALTAAYAALRRAACPPAGVAGRR